MKRICMITTVSGTMKTFVLETAKHLHNVCGYDVTLICSPDDEFVKSLPEYLHYIPVKMPRGADLAGFKSIKVFGQIFKEQKFDLVQYSTPNASCYASIAAKKENIPIRLYCQWGIRYVGLTGLKRKIFKLLEKTVCRNSTHIRAVSSHNMSFAIKEGLYSENKACVIGNGGTIGVDLTDYDISKKEQWRKEIRKKYSIKEDEFVFGFVGRISVDKGCGELLKAFKSLSEQDKKVKLMLIGANENTDGTLSELIKQAKNSDRVIITGNIPAYNMKKYYSALDVLVHPTYREGFGMVIQEAGALGVPVITTKIPGASEVMENDISCILVAPKDEAELLSAMRNISSNSERARKIGTAAYERTEKRYARPIMLSHQEKDYKMLLRNESEIKRIVLSDRAIANYTYPYDSAIKTIDCKGLDDYNHNPNVIAIVGSRAMAVKAAGMDFPNLKLFQLTSAGFDGVPNGIYAQKGIAVANAGSVYSVPISETVVFGILSMAKKLRNNPNNRHFKLQRHYSTITELAGKNVLIMGAGNIGTAIADRLKGFEMQIDGYDPYCPIKEQYQNIWRTRDELKNNLSKYDYIVSTLPDNSETNKSINSELFDKMKQTAVIINVGRRAVFDENDFYSALKNHKIGGAVLDMFEKLPNPITNKFRRLRNVIVMPGVSAISKEVNERLKEHIYNNLDALLSGNEASSVINGVKF